MSPDILNAGFEFFGAVAVAASVRKAWRARSVVGVDWKTPAFFWSWGVFNLFYYPHLDQWASTVAGACVLLANTAWLGVVITYGRKH
jgi:hypothetical protein